MRKSVLMIPLLSLWAVVALAGPPSATTAVSPAKVAKIRVLMKSFNMTESIARERSICIQNFMTSLNSPERFAAAKGAYRGFKPGTPEWPKVLEAYKTYSEQSCSYLVPEPYEDAYIKFYDSRLSEADIDAYLAFQKTPAAQHMLAIQQDKDTYMAQFDRQLSEPAFKKASEQLTASLASIQ